ncbi:hypothetical protein AB0H73_18545 [Streptomyces olivoreticuli]
MTTTLITYRLGAWLVDTQRGRVGRMCGTEKGVAHLRSPAGDEEWETAPDALRLASRDELMQAGIWLRVSWVGPASSLVYVGPAEGSPPFVVSWNGCTQQGEGA